jgi:hypothetical protein
VGEPLAGPFSSGRHNIDVNFGVRFSANWALSSHGCPKINPSGSNPYEYCDLTTGWSVTAYATIDDLTNGRQVGTHFAFYFINGSNWFRLDYCSKGSTSYTCTLTNGSFGVPSGNVTVNRTLTVSFGGVPLNATHRYELELEVYGAIFATAPGFPQGWGGWARATFNMASSGNGAKLRSFTIH